ncbi:PAS domain S-box protein [Aromatoleum toluvorans]|uniref:histidine kinase n=1 Tax=Aromatoleum toluvorans TaxID=92002 RepID=A0ABX1Q6C6_9RHOO|nr:PAS domain-containing sensor histidine kinase [Aromatoleum toluvorans]NMG45921.1 PAS domain S-box protein [Aromatoleum toluvorans]
MADELQSLLRTKGQDDLSPLFDVMLEGVVVRDGAGRIIASNHTAQRIYGLSAAELEGQTAASLPVAFLNEDGSACAADQHPAMVTLRTGLPQRGVIMGIAHPGREPVWIQVNSQPLADTVGCITSVITSFADITPIKRAEDALRASEVRNRTLAEAIAQSGCSVIITDRNGRIEYVNPACCKAYGYSEEELIGARPSIFKSGETTQEEYANLWGTILTGQTWRGEMSNRSRDGRLIREAVSVSPVRDESGEVRHFVALKEDITQMRDDERRRHELFERVARLERMELVATLAGGIAHDFNNVLAAILGYSQLASTQLKADGRLPRVVKYVDEIRAAGQRARELIQQLLSFRRGGAVQPGSSQVVQIGREVVGLLRATLPDTLAVVADIEPDLPQLSVDPAHVHQIMMNLLINARDAITGIGTIRLSAERASFDAMQRCDSCRHEFRGDFLAITVTDVGMGISAEHREKLFEPFFTTKDVGCGTGMGLAVVHTLTHLYEGHVRVESELGKGTAVQVLLPARLLQEGGAA